MMSAEKKSQRIINKSEWWTQLQGLLDMHGQNRCTSLVCSCYAPSANFNNKVEVCNNTRKGSLAEKKENGVMEEARNDESVQDHQKSNGGRNSGSCTASGSNNGPHLETSPLKSTLKKTSSSVAGGNQARKDRPKRKVSWPDIAHGADIAHVLEFESSTSDDGELEGVRNSCVCTIQ
ncbi:LIGHT-HARVESTING COMPLEX-LIKE PROTEIN OHP2 CHLOROPLASTIC [Salix viminalis]|uniref:LIGHT-HARVESTING COMPLEX-LIKE PROTEIN OHP2 CHLOROPLASTIC n=1 Tax=Salix viminalis TaxID=40686 RepID=A0A6N2MM61_SALVM|nr:LIGHT-HARVESTING COMPLEX-LIKE PROTEIN OHP2 CHLOROPLASTIC [Salix viminalis]